MQSIEVLAFVLDTYYYRSLKEDLLKKSKNCLIIVYDFRGFLRIDYSPKGFQIKKRQYCYGSANSALLSNAFITYPVLFIQLFRILSYVFLKYNVKKAVSENTYAAFFIGVFRWLRRCKKSYYIAGDWLATKKHKSWLSFFYNNVFFVFFDFFACSLNDITFSTASAKTARKKYWRREISNTSLIFNYWRSQVVNRSVKNNVKKTKVFFFGAVREDSGIELVLEAIKLLHGRFPMKLKIAGPLTGKLKSILKGDSGRIIEYIGMIDLDKLPGFASDCLCGVNIITDLQSFSKYGIPSKIIYYLQNLLPIITTCGISDDQIEIIKKNHLGFIMKPKIVEIKNSILNIHKRRFYYRNNIINYIKNNKRINFFDTLP